MPRGVPRIPEPWENVRKKTCSHCVIEKTWADFSPLRYWDDGTVRIVGSWCHGCRAERNKTYGPLYYARNRETVKARNQRLRARRQIRMHAEQSQNHGTRMNAGPLRTYLERYEDRGGSLEDLAEISGASERVLRRVKNGESEKVSLHTIDRVLVARGEHIRDVYPEYEAAA